MRRQPTFAAFVASLTLAGWQPDGAASPTAPAGLAAAPRLITKPGALEATWVIDAQAVAFWCERTVAEVGQLAWFAELADVATNDLASFAPALEACLSRRRARHGQLGLALPPALAIKAAQGGSFSPSERWLLGYVDHIIIDDALVASVGKVANLAPLLDKPELRGIGTYRVHATATASTAARACAWLDTLANATTTRLTRLYVSPACDDALPTSRLPTLAALTGLTSSSALALRWQARLPALAEYQVADPEDDAAWGPGLGAPAALLTKMKRLRISERQWQTLRARPLPLVRELHVELAALSLAQVGALAQTTSFPALEQLTISLPALAPDVHRALWSQLAFGNLRRLAVHASATMGRREATAMVESAQLRGLVELELVGVVMSGEAIEMIAEARAVASLQVLALRLAGLDARKLAALVRGPALRPSVLDLSQNPLPGAALAAFSRAPITGSLSELRLVACALDDAAARALAATYGFFSLRYLDVAHNAFTEAGLAALLRSGSFADVGWLDLFSGHTPSTALTCAAQIARPLPSGSCTEARPLRR